MIRRLGTVGSWGHLKDRSTVVRPEGNRPPESGRGLGFSFFAAAASVAVAGLARFIFNTVGIQRFGAAYLGEVNFACSSATVLGVLAGTVPSVLVGKFVSEELGRGDPERAGRILAGLLALAAGAGAVGTAACFVLAGSASILCPYVALYSISLWGKAAYFAHRLGRRYFLNELLSFMGFLFSFTAGCLLASPTIATVSLLVQPFLFCLVAAADFRPTLRFRGAFRGLGLGGRAYLTFSSATFANALVGLGSFHLLVILAGLLFPDKEQVGQLALLLALLAPLNFFPLALGSVLLPEMARLFGQRDEESQRVLLRRSVMALEAVTVLAAGPLLAWSDRVLPAVGAPAVVGLRITWGLLVIGAALSAVSSPCGHFLNATRYVARHAALSTAFFGLGVVAAPGLMGGFGLPGAALVRLIADGGAAAGRMLLAERFAGWSEPARTKVALAMGLLAIVFGTIGGLGGRLRYFGVCGWGAIGLILVCSLLRDRGLLALERTR